MRIETVAVMLAIAVATAGAQPEKPQPVTLVTAQRQTVRQGDPIEVSVSVSNQAPQVVEVDRSATAFDCFEVTDPDGRALPYVGFDGQVVIRLIRVEPSSTIKIADALDLTDKYLFQKAGRYTIRFRGGPAGVSDSRALTIDLTPGRVSEFDQVAASLLPVCPSGWHLAKDRRGEVVPFGRVPAAGFALHLCRNYMQGEAVYLWFTRAEAQIDPDRKPRVKVEYLGRARGLYIYAAVDKNTPPLWPTATEDISRALQIGKVPRRAGKGKGP